MADRSKEKAEWLRKVRDEIRPAYARLLSLGRLILQCDDGSEVAIRFTKSAFAHLCGFEYYMDSHKERRARQSDFYDDIVRRNFTAKRADYTHRHNDRNTSYEKRRSHTKSKLDIAGEAFNHVATAAYVVESAKSGLILFAGDERWALGLSEQVNKKDERTGDYIPASLVNESVLSESIHRRCTRVRSVVSARWE